MKDERYKQGREFLKDTIRLKTDFCLTDQYRGKAPPSLQKITPSSVKTIELPEYKESINLRKLSLYEAIKGRRSRRNFLEEPLLIDELSFLLWATQGISNKLDSGYALRTVPSAGCRHPFETYLAVFNVKGLEKGIYRYLPLNNSLICEKKTKDLKALLIEASLGQDFTGHSALCFIWTALPYRTEWRYGPVSHKVIAIDAGHLCQNLYLSCAAVGCGTCAIAAYDQKKMDDLLGVDGDEEFTVYLAPVGKIDFGKEV